MDFLCGVVFTLALESAALIWATEKLRRDKDGMDDQAQAQG